jgi:integrase
LLFHGSLTLPGRARAYPGRDRNEINCSSRPPKLAITEIELETEAEVALVALLLENYRGNGNRSLVRAQGALKHLRKAFGSDRAVDIKTRHLMAYVRERTDAGATRATVAYELAVLKRAMSIAVEAELLPYRPKFPTIRLDNARTGFFEEPEFRAVLAELPQYLRPVVSFAYLTGWRIRSEVLPLAWAQVDLDAGTVRLEPGTTKNRKGRLFPLRALPELEALLREQRERTDQLQRERGVILPWVFPRQGRRLYGFYRTWRTACKRAAVLKDAEGKPVEREGKVVIVRPELLGKIPHDFRRTAVRNLVRAGVSEKVAMELTGHKTRAVFERYNIVSERDLSEAVTRLAALREKQAESARKLVSFPTTETVRRQSAG